jgi:hypothetical protein
MDDKTHEGIKVHKREEGNGDSTWQPRCNITQHAQTKHIDVQHHFVQEQVENGEVMFEYCSMEDIVPNVFTKALSKERLNKLITMFWLESL